MTKTMIKNLGIVLSVGILTGCYNNYNPDKKTHPLHSNPATQIKAGVAANKGKPTKDKRITYSVFGKSYKVLPTSTNYQEVGVASWYGRPFHQRYTSSGERYNMFKMTAAHKTLPLSTYVIVTNLKNNKQVRVKINDRGPFVGNRIIDLSYAAAKQLGMVGSGVAEVSVRAVHA